MTPATPADAKGLLAEAIRQDDPVIFCEHKALYMEEGDVPEGEFLIPFGQARIAREGTDVTLCGMSRMAVLAEQAAAVLAAEGISAEVVDPRTLSPLDEGAILNSVTKTHRLVVVDEANPLCSMASEIAGMVAEFGFDYLDAPIQRVTAPHTPVPATPSLEKNYVPSVDDIVAAAKKALDY